MCIVGKTLIAAMIQITPSGIAIISSNQHQRKVTLPNLDKRGVNNGFSNASRRLMLQRVSDWYALRWWDMKSSNVTKAKEKTVVSFNTLTLPTDQKHSDNQIKSVCLNGYLNKLRYHYGTFDYVWRAEPQERGAIHFHMLANIYIDKDFNRQLWCDSLDLLGYVTNYMKKGKVKLPPCTQIEYADRMTDVQRYCAKYTAKVAKGRKIEGRQWFSSSSVTTDYRVNVTTHKQAEERIKEILNTSGMYSTATDYTTKYYFNRPEQVKLLPLDLQKEYNKLITMGIYRMQGVEDVPTKYREDVTLQLSHLVPTKKLRKDKYRHFDTRQNEVTQLNLI